MPRLSRKASELIGWLRQPGLSKEGRLELLREIAATRQVNAASHLLAEFASYDLPASEVAPLLGSLAVRITTADLIAWSKHPGEDPAYMPWQSYWEKLLTFRAIEGGWAAFAIATMSRSGFVRERAVSVLDELLHDGREILFLLYRTADHVPSVRRIATAAVQSRLSFANGGQFVAALPLMRRLQLRERAERSVLDWVLELLASPLGAPLLAAGLRSNDREIRRECFDLALNLRTPGILQLALQDPDRIIRMKAARRLDATTARLAIGDEHSSVRAIAYEKLAGPNAEPTLWMRALVDSSSTIRMMARLWLSKHTQVDVAAFYRSAVAAGDSLGSAIAGLAESCPPEDAAELLFITKANARVREQLVAALAKMLRAEATDALIPMLADPSSRVALKAQRALERYSTPALAETVWRLLPSAPARRTRQLLRLLAAQPSRWVSLDYLLRATELPEPISTEAAAQLGKWRSAPRPLSRPEAIALRDRVRSLPGGLLPDKVVANLNSALDYWVREGK